MAAFSTNKLSTEENSMTWEGPRISLIGAQAVFGQAATIEKQLGHYKATLQSGQTLEGRTLMELCQSIVKELAGSGSAPEEYVSVLRPLLEVAPQSLPEQGLTRLGECVESNYAVFRSADGDGVRAVKLGKPGTGVPEGQTRRDGEFGVVIDSVSPEVAIWKASLEYHGDAIAGLIRVLGGYLDEIEWDRERVFCIEVVDEVFKDLNLLHEEGLPCTAGIKDLTPHWTVPAQEPTSNPDQLTLI